MTIITDAETIRDETATGANTAARVGGNLVDIATQVTANQAGVAANAASILTLKDFGARLSMRDNATGTAIASAGTFYKVAGTTGENFASGFTLTSNRMTYAPADGVARGFVITATIAATCATGNHDLRVRLAINGTTDPSSEVMSYTASGRSNSITLSAAYLFNDGDYVEVFITDDDAGETVTVTHLQMIAEPYSVNVIGSYCFEAILYFNSIPVQPTTTEKNAINTAIVALKNAGYWSRIDALFVPREAHDQSAGLMDWKRLISASLLGSATWAQNKGFVGSVTAGSAVNSAFIPSSNGVNYKLNDCSMMAYVGKLPTADNKSLFGRTGGTANQAIYLKKLSTLSYDGKINASAGGGSGTGVAATGLNCISRTASSAWRIDVNGANVYTDTDTSGGLSTSPIYLCGLRNETDDFVGEENDSEIAMWLAGDYFTTAEQSAIKTIFDNYFTALA